MLKIFHMSLLFFVIEMLLFIKYDPQIGKVFLNFSVKHFDFIKSQKEALAVSHKLSQKQDKIVYLVGGSTGDQFFTKMPKIGYKKYQYCKASIPLQTLLDQILIMDNIDENSKDNIFVIALFFYKLYRSFDEQEFLIYRYETGYRYKWFLESPELQTFFEKHTTEKSGVTHKIFPAVNKYCSVLKSTMFFYEVNRLEKIRQQKNVDNKTNKAYLEKIERYKKAKGKYRQLRATMSEEALKMNFVLFEKLCLLAKRKNIKLGFIDIPVEPDLEIEFQEDIEKFNQFLDELKQKYPDIFHWKYKQQSLPQEAIFTADGYHVTKKGRELFGPYIEKGIEHIIDN